MKVSNVLLNIKFTFFKDMMPYSLTERYWYFTETCCLHHQGKMEQAGSSAPLNPIYKNKMHYSHEK